MLRCFAGLGLVSSFAILATSAWAAELPPASVAPKPRVVITQPIEGVPVSDRATVAVRVDGVVDADIVSATVSIDGKPLGVIEEPPWIGTFPIEIEESSRKIAVSVRLADGRIIESSRKTAPLVMQEAVDVRLVNLAVSVTNESGAPVTDLGRDDFRVRDGRKPATIERWSEESQALAVMLLIDTSASMRGERLETALRAAQDFVGKFEERDRVGLLVFNHEVIFAEPPSHDFDQIRSMIEPLKARGGTALYDALHEASTLLDASVRGMRRVAIVISDGRDAAQTGWQVASKRLLAESIARAHQDDVIVYTIGIGEQLRHEPTISLDMSREDRLRAMTGAVARDAAGRPSVPSTADVLDMMSRSTGGRSIVISSASGLGPAFDALLNEMRHQYMIAFRPAAGEGSGEEWREIEVTVSRPDLKVRTRRGYLHGVSRSVD